MILQFIEQKYSTVSVLSIALCIHCSCAACLAQNLIGYNGGWVGGGGGCRFSLIHHTQSSFCVSLEAIFSHLSWLNFLATYTTSEVIILSFTSLTAETPAFISTSFDKKLSPLLMHERGLAELCVHALRAPVFLGSITGYMGHCEPPPPPSQLCKSSLYIIQRKSVKNPSLGKEIRKSSISYPSYAIIILRVA